MLFCHLALLVHCAINKSICFDEGAHFAAGLAYLKHGEMSIYNLSPPAVRYWVALPAYLAGADVPPAKRHRNEPDRIRTWNYFDAVRNTNLPYLHRYVLWGRFMNMPISLVVAVGIFIWSRKLYGDVAGLIACGVWSFSPTVIAHGSTLGTDMPLTAAMLLAIASWHAFLQTGSKSRAFLAAAAIALAHTIKFTAILLWPMLFIVAIPFIMRNRQRWRDVLAGATIAVVITFVVFNASYGFRLMGDRLDYFRFESATMQRVQRTLPAWLPMPFHRDAVRGFDAQKFEAESQYVTALFGRGYFGNSWMYYPWLVVTKSTIGGLVMLAIGVISFAWIKPRRDEWPLFVLAIGMLLGMTLAARINIGIRYLLPAFPAVIILISRATFILRLKTLMLIALVAIAVESLANTPRMHSFVNVAIRPRRWLVPDQDWGQSMIALRRWIDANNVDRVLLIGPNRLCPQPYGIPLVADVNDPAVKYVAISRCSLEGVPYISAHGFILVRPWRTLRETAPLADLGGIVVYDIETIRRCADGEPWLAVFNDWQDAVLDPKLAPIAGLRERLQLSD